ncbi:MULTISPECIES: hypothetical protein [unclassified Tolypothrix]|uniref:hypothetical protein n=1 Tax=unclassified Tolypothrix TaxID=2649714 RepID=UPI0005EABB3F|nr:MULTISPECIES: hypothetical protein [unclassified Tolypothrix]BAY95291.1 hypothetical protein NIES3275_73480 [Microchaete diplosiphon NIES-3275]EKE98296.1 hypothetical protein FDUTEX481_04419 [Tolypothrix sp. PCC 7601]MBE9084010.1 hypothetical protein [Tolypothrix sp. LEGE 11397]UYD30514.1 hypothetical protein HGR01_37410 [Tolypothrix sp. PCC 7712]UYD38353.1 hypothetical protein HG267_38305 [Tolypothrix sp. PCC 7601]
MSSLLEAILKQAQGLSREEQLELIQHLTEQVSTQSETPAKPKRKVTEFYGVVPNLLSGMDAQVWVDQLRSEWDERKVLGALEI